VEDIFDTPCADYQDILSQKRVKKKPKRQGPTMKSHSQVEHPSKQEWAPSDEEEDLGFRTDNDDYGYKTLPFV
jgi:hypothetical protein